MIKERERKELPVVVQFVKKNFWILLIVILSLLFNLIVLYQLGGLQEQCNEHWMEQFELSGCTEKVIPYGESFNLSDDIIISNNNHGGINDEEVKS